MKEKKRFTIGMLVDTTKTVFEKTVTQAVADGAMHWDCNLIVFACNFSYNEENQQKAEQKSIFDMAVAAELDGIILSSDRLLLACNKQFFDKLLLRLGNTPKISIIYKKPGLCSVNYDDNMGMYRIIDHLIKVHNKRRLAFITGKLDAIDDDARVRFELYKKCLKDNNIPYDEDLVIYGDFWYPSGSKAIGTLIDERHATFDALVSSNDFMAITAIDELKKMGFRVPEDIAVTGYDNVQESLNIEIELTTVTQSAYALGYKAVSLLVSKLKGEAIPEESYIPTVPVIRKSCGCLNDAVQDQIFLSLDKKDYVKEIARIITNQFTLYLTPELEELYSQWAFEIAVAFNNSLIHKSISSFNMRFTELFINRERIHHIPLFIWNDIFTHVFDFIKPIAQGANTGFIFKFYQSIHTLLKDYTLKSESDIHAFTHTANILDFLNLHTEYTKPNLAGTIKYQVEYNDMKSFFLSLVKDDNTLTSIYSFFNGASDINPVDYPISRIIPQGIKSYNKRFSLVLGSLYDESVYNGFVGTEIGHISLNFFDFLTLKVSSLIRGIELLDEVKEYSKNLEQLVSISRKQLVEFLPEIIHAAGQAAAADILKQTSKISSPGDLQALQQYITAQISEAPSVKKPVNMEFPPSIQNEPRVKALVPYYKHIYEDLKKQHEILQIQLNEIEKRMNLLKAESTGNEKND